MMPRDFYVSFPLDLPNLPTVRRLRRSHGSSGVLMYYELRILVAQALQYGQNVNVSDVLEISEDWDMDEDSAMECLATMAASRLIEPEALEDGFIGIEDVAARAVYLEKKADAGRKGGQKSRRVAQE